MRRSGRGDCCQSGWGNTSLTKKIFPGLKIDKAIFSIIAGFTFFKLFTSLNCCFDVDGLSCQDYAIRVDLIIQIF